MTITQLRYVLAVAEHQNFTKAAKKVFVTQPTLSMQIQKLEEELAIQIFKRDKKPIELTEVGKRIVNQARKIVDESERIQDIVDQQKGFIGGEFKIGIIPTVMPTLLPMFLKTLVTKYPQIDLKIEDISTDQLIDKLEEGHLDIGIAATPLEQENLNERVLYYEPFVGYVPENHPLAKKNKINKEDIDINEVLLLKDGHCFKDNILNLCHAKKGNTQQKFDLYSGSFETLMGLCDEGLGMTLLPYLNSLKLDEKAQQKIKYFEDPVPAREISLVYPKSKLKIQIISALYDVISSVVKGAIAFQDVNIISPLRK